MALTPEIEQKIVEALNKIKDINVLQDALSILIPQQQALAQSEQTEQPVEAEPAPASEAEVTSQTDQAIPAQVTAPEESEPAATTASEQSEPTKPEAATTSAEVTKAAEVPADNSTSTAEGATEQSVQDTAPADQAAAQSADAAAEESSKEQSDKEQSRDISSLRYVGSDGKGKSTVSNPNVWNIDMDNLPKKEPESKQEASKEQSSEKSKEPDAVDFDELNGKNFEVSKVHSGANRTLKEPNSKTIESEYKYRGPSKLVDLSGKEQKPALDLDDASSYISDKDNRIDPAFEKELDQQIQNDNDASYKELAKAAGIKEPSVLKKLATAAKNGVGKVKDSFKNLSNKWKENRILRNVNSGNVNPDDLLAAFDAAPTKRHKFGDSKEIDGAVIEFQAALARRDYALLESTIQLVNELKEYRLLEKDQSYAFLKDYFANLNEDYQGLVGKNK